MTPSLRLVPTADDFATDRIDPLEDTVEIERIRELPPVPAPPPRRRERSRRDDACLVALVVIAFLVALTVGLLALDALVSR